MLIEALALSLWFIAYLSSGLVVTAFGLRGDVMLRHFILLFGSTILVGAIYFGLSIWWALSEHAEIVRRARILWAIFGGAYSVGVYVVFVAVYMDDFRRLFTRWTR